MRKLTHIACMLILGGMAWGQTYKVIWNFAGAPDDGANPVNGLILDTAGNLYGTTEQGGKAGTIFELMPNGDGTWSEKILYNFCANYNGDICPDGNGPSAGLVFDSKGNLYGTTINGGVVCTWDTAGCGTVFELSPPSVQGGAWSETVLYDFCTTVENYECIDGSFPTSQLVLDGSGNLYGTTQYGGTGKGLANGSTLGTAFELSPGSSGWTETVLYNFCSVGDQNYCPDGASPSAGLTFDQYGNLYGTTFYGGASRGLGGGIVYELSPTSNGWTETVVHTFPYFGNGSSPAGAISLDSAGNLYSSLYNGGSAGDGGVFQLRMNPKKEHSIAFSSNDAGQPAAGVLIDEKNHVVYGTTTGNHDNYRGTVFMVDANGEITVLHNFCQQTNCTDGGNPFSTLVIDSQGNLYGTAKEGGAYGLYDPPYSYGNGVIFEITP